MPPSGTRPTRKRKPRSVRPSTSMCAKLLSRDNVSPQPDKSATQCMRSSARPFTRTCVLTSTELSMNLTQRPNAPPSTRRTANTNGRATETTRSGHQSPEHARATPTMSARMCQDKFVSRFQTRCVETSPLSSVPRCQDRSAQLNTRVPVRVSKRVPKKVCDEGYGSNSGLPETFDLRENQPSHKTQSNNQKIVFGH